MDFVSCDEQLCICNFHRFRSPKYERLNQNVYKNEKRIRQLLLQRGSNTRPSGQVKFTFAEAKNNGISFTGLAEAPD